MNEEELAEYIKENNARYDRLRQLDIESLDEAYRRFESLRFKEMNRNIKRRKL